MWGGAMGAAAVAEDHNPHLSGPVPSLEQAAEEAAANLDFSRTNV
jgi:hypothetical protein